MKASRLLAQDYSATAPEYAALWGPVILPMALPLLASLPLEQASRVLDAGTGVGGLIRYLRLHAPSALIYGVDYSEGMVRRGIRTETFPGAVMDAQHLGIRSGVMDVIVMAFMLFHLPQPLRGLAEAKRVLKSEGWIGLTTWSRDPGLPGAALWSEELDRLGAVADPRDPIVRQHELVDSPEKISQLLGDAGFRSIETWRESFEHAWDPESLLLLQYSLGVAGRRLATLSAQAQADCVDRVRERMARLEELVWRPEVLFSIAQT